MCFTKHHPVAKDLRYVPRSGEAESIGQLLFRHRFGHRWNFSAFDLRQVDLPASASRRSTPIPRGKSAQPASNFIVLDGQASRFFKADYNSRAMDRDMRNAAQNFKHMDQTMAALGFICAGAVVCERA